VQLAECELTARTGVKMIQPSRVIVPDLPWADAAAGARTDCHCNLGYSSPSDSAVADDPDAACVICAEGTYSSMTVEAKKGLLQTVSICKSCPESASSPRGR
jgi:hypothetical protein